MPQKDYYKILGVDKNASQDQIKSAYRKMAKQYHPDLHPGDNAAAEKFKEVNEAYSVVGDPDKRGKYDRGEMDMDGASGFNPFGGGGGFSAKMSPSAVLVIKNGTTKLVNIKNQDMVTKVIDMIPDIVDKFTAPKEEMMEDDAAVDIAFPEENK